MPEVSIIVPVYNVEPYLCQCVDNVLSQSFTDFELILVDDGSPDASGAICDEYAAQDNRVHVIHQENAGQGKARNVGMDQAVGKYVIFLDSDDYWVPSTLETLYSEAERNQTQVLVFGAIPFWDGMEEPKSHPTYQQTVQNGVVKSGPESLKVALDAGEYYVPPYLRFYLLEYLRETGLHFDEGIIHEDETISLLAYLLANRVECIGDRLYHRRYRSGSTMTSKSTCNSARGYRVVLDGLLDAYDNLKLSPLGKKQLERGIARKLQLFCNCYREALKQKRSGWQATRLIQKDGRQTLKRARRLPNLPLSLRLATYSLFFYCFVHKAIIHIKRLVSAVRNATYISSEGASKNG